MPEWVALSKTTHRDVQILSRDDYHFAAGERVVSVLLAELDKLLPHFVLGFIVRGESYVPVALLSLGGQRNLYVTSGGKWIGPYVPALLRGYPFALAGEGEKRVLAVDAEQLVMDGGNALFDGDAPSDTVTRTLEFLQQCESSRRATQAATQALVDAKVLGQWPLTVSRGGAQTPQEIRGLYRVDEAALNALGAEDYASLQGAPMALAYAQLFSVSQLDQLSERDKVLAEKGGDPEDLDALFEEGEDDLGFDFD